MAEDTSPVPSPHPFVEVFCEISGKYYRFATGTKAEFAVSVINRKLDSSKSKALYIEAAKEGEEPISFGDGASLVSYGHGWRLKTVIDVSDFPGTEKENTFQRQFPSVLLSTGSKDSKPAKTMKAEVEGDQSLKYIGRIMFAFLLMFILGGLFTVALENLPRLILLFNNPSIIGALVRCKFKFLGQLKFCASVFVYGTDKEGPFQRQFPSVLSTGSKDSKPAKAMKAEFEGDQSLKYIGRIMFAFVLMFILGGLFTVALENLPRLILLFTNPSMNNHIRLYQSWHAPSASLYGFALQGSKDSKPAKAMNAEFEGDQSLKYIGRIMFAFVLMFILGGLFTVALENLPRLILLFTNPSM
ncbi:hypothetical protein F2Q69_00015998 [Brassica cretica]|uniref:Uncharacterized protein n=1 Tax=Brassica cretica TaxID=69181 RepID=A0A8S9QJR2_BRACR|nr:hypothetical protein F2Q69_00015998 [Brassica cretica]